jgi:hypothetical protein
VPLFTDGMEMVAESEVVVGTAAGGDDFMRGPVCCLTSSLLLTGLSPSIHLCVADLIE